MLLERLAGALFDARARSCLTGASATRGFTAFEYQTQKTGSRVRRVIGKSEVSAAGDNPRGRVPHLPTGGFPGEGDATRFELARLYEGFHGARGEMENVRQQQVPDLEADRLSTDYLASNQLRLGLATLACLLLERVRAIGGAGTALARATAGSVRLKWLKVAAVGRGSVRRVPGQWSRAGPGRETFTRCAQALALWVPNPADPTLEAARKRQTKKREACRQKPQRNRRWALRDRFGRLWWAPHKRGRAPNPFSALPPLHMQRTSPT